MNNFCLFPRQGGVWQPGGEREIEFPPLVVDDESEGKAVAWNWKLVECLMFIILINGNQCSFAVKETFFYGLPSSIGTISVESLPSK